MAEEPTKLNENFRIQVFIGIVREAIFLEVKEVGRENIVFRTVAWYEWELPGTTSNKWYVTVINDN